MSKRNQGGAGTAPSPARNAASYGQGSNYQLTELKNVGHPSSSTYSPDDEFNSRLLDTVRGHPCLYDSSHEHFSNNKHANAQVRAGVWQQIIRSLEYSGDAHSLQLHWKRLRERYMKVRKMPQEDQTESDLSLCDSMQWMEEFINDEPKVNETELFYMDAIPQDAPDVMLGDFEEEFDQPGSSNGASRMQRSGSHDSNHSTGSNISVGDPSCGLKPPSTTKTSTGQTLTLLSNVQGNAGRGSGHQQYKIVRGHARDDDGSTVTVTAQGTAGVASNVKKIGTEGGVTLIIDPTRYYQNGTQKMYRLVNVADLDQNTNIHLSAGAGRPPRKRFAVAPLSAGGPPPPPPTISRGQLGDDLILDDGIGERTVVIDQQSGGESPLLEDSGMNSMLMGGSSRLHRQHSPSGVRMSSPSRYGSAPHHYDGEIAFQNMISSHLQRLGDDEKAVMKMHIQRILLDARFGIGTTARIVGDEELTDAATNSVNHDLSAQ